MEAKTSEWRPGPTVCRCCLTEGCYKDISTEYFWMGKREVYSEMLSETLNVTIAYSQSGGPNSNSRLICEPCISRLRDASDFRRQIIECEKTFMQHLDPGSSKHLDEIVVQLEAEDKEVKLERVKLEKRLSDDDFDDRVDFGDDDDDDDDLDDQPLTKLASKVPKKESVDLLDLLDNSKAAEKRKSTTKIKAPPPKKVKPKKEIKPAPSKVAPKPEKKKKGTKTEEVQIKPDAIVVAAREREERRATYIKNISILMESCTAYPFKYEKGTYLCFFCKHRAFTKPDKLRDHNMTQHSNIKQLPKPMTYEPLKMDFATALCKICNLEITDYEMLKNHLMLKHGKVIDWSNGDSVLPYKLRKDDHCCQICDKRYEMFLSLDMHMNKHHDYFICEICGKKFPTSQLMANHAQKHANKHSI